MAGKSNEGCQPNIAHPAHGPQPGYPMSTIQPAQGQQTTTLVMSPPTVVPSRPASWTNLSTVSCLFCFWPIGLVAMIFSFMVGSPYDKGDYENAKRYSSIAKRLSIASIICGFIVILGIIILYASRASSSSYN